jgi:hypothetical protein
MTVTTEGFDIELGEHLCVVHDGPAERDRVLGRYLARGISSGHKCLFGVHDATQEALLHRLGPGHGFDTAVRSGQLELRTPENPVSDPEDFSLAGLLDFWGNATTTALDDGYEFVRLGAESRWWEPQTPDTETFIRYESELTKFAPTLPQAIVCVYDVRRDNLDSAFVMNVIRVHPRVMIYGLILDNPYYLRTEELPG